MAGYGSTCKLTSAYSTRVLVAFSGTMANNTTSDATAYSIRYGTGTAPTSGAAASGTQIGPTYSSGGGANPNVGFVTTDVGIITGLSPGTAYWFDLAINAVVGGTITASNSCSAVEF